MMNREEDGATGDERREANPRSVTIEGKNRFLLKVILVILKYDCGEQNIKL